MYATAYRTAQGFSSVGFLGGFDRSGRRIRVADPVFGWQVVDADDCFCTIFTESGFVLPDVKPALIDSLVSNQLLPQEERMAANKKVVSMWLEPELGGDKFPSGYPLAWQRIERWRNETAPDWRSLALSAIFARSSIQRPIEECERLYREFGPTLRDWLLRGTTPTAAQMKQWRGVRGTRAAKRGYAGGLDDLRSFESILEWAPEAATILRSTKDTSRKVRDAVSVEFLPWGLGIAKVSFTMMLAGRDASCMDTRMLNYFFGSSEAGAEEFDVDQIEAEAEHYGEDYASNPRAWSPPQTRLQFLGRVSSRSTAENARGLTRGAVKTYSWLEDKLAETPYFDPDWPQPYAKAQWMLWETLGRTAGTADHGALWEVIDPLIEEITGRPLEKNPAANERDIERAAQLLAHLPHDEAFKILVDDGMDPDTAHHALRAADIYISGAYT